MGNIAAAQNVAFNSLFALNGYNPTMLQMLVRIELMRGNYLVALKYITLLEKTVHYAGWATAQRRFLFDDEAVEQDPSLGTGDVPLSPWMIHLFFWRLLWTIFIKS